jgi:hypothetical protein
MRPHECQGPRPTQRWVHGEGMIPVYVARGVVTCEAHDVMEQRLIGDS